MDEFKSVVTNRPRDCVLCKLISGFGLTGVGVYIGKQANSMKRIQKSIYYSIALGAVGIGVARLLDLPPFDNSTFKSEER